ncbi:VOC family protein [Deinococcus radiophilus]|uniref:VOC family protein n=1 Tax=Deinococcus radiophilus TaxID=32062 RepID=UPI00226E9CFA|nr:VOC family protein [Deinococcus radiophilus]UFA51213.1 VOC family protein [Deinococcus radiophilus]
MDDVSESLTFYRDVLGFEVMGENASYKSLRFGESRIAVQDVRTLEPGHPLAGPGKRGLGVEFVLEVGDVTALHQRVQKQWAHVTGLKRQAWGLTDFRVTDPDGYYWRITEQRR